jgi:hypothetical protein
MIGPEQAPSKMLEEVLSVVVRLLILVVLIIFLFRRKQREVENMERTSELENDPAVLDPITVEERQTLIEEYSSMSDERLVMLLFEAGLRSDARYLAGEEMKRRGIRFAVGA